LNSWFAGLPATLPSHACVPAALALPSLLHCCQCVGAIMNEWLGCSYTCTLRASLYSHTLHPRAALLCMQRPSPPISPSARFPTARSPSSGRGDLFASSLPRSQSAAVGTRAGSYVSDAMLGTGKDFKYGQPDVFDAQVCVAWACLRNPRGCCLFDVRFALSRRTSQPIQCLPLCWH